MLQEIFDLFRAREPIPFIILAVACAGWVVILERFIILQFVYRINFSRFTQNIKKMLAAGDLTRARSYCKATSGTGLPNIVLRAIDAFESDASRVRMVMSEETLSFLPRIRRRISQLPTLAACAVLLGALASVHGVWQSFSASDVLEMGIKSLAFTRGLATALNPLAVSLGVAVLLLLPYGILDAIAARLEADMEHSLTVTVNILAPEGQYVAAVAAPAAQRQSARENHVSDESAMSSVAPDTDSDSMSMAQNKNAAGGIEDVPGPTEAVLDEEEII